MQAAPSKRKTVEITFRTKTGPASPIQNVGGSHFNAVNMERYAQVANALWTGGCTPKEEHDKQQVCLEALIGISPQDDVEGMLAAQMVACHNAAMECYRRAMIPDQSFEGRQQNLNFANKLSRTYALHMEALDRHRGKGSQQKVEVHHVHVHKGAQAIVGNVANGGRAQNSEEQPHAIQGKQLTNSQEQPLRGTFTAKRKAVPVSSDG